MGSFYLYCLHDYQLFVKTGKINLETVKIGCIFTLQNTLTMALTIGFTNVYYTLWSVSEPFKKYDPQNSFSWAMQISYNYLQNLTMGSLEEAERKLQQMYPGYKYEIDLDLRGDHGPHFVKTMFKGNDCAQYMFAIGRLMGQDMRTFDINFRYIKDLGNGELKEITTASYLWGTYLKKNANDVTLMDLRRAAIARQRMVKEGILVKHEDGKYYTPAQIERMAQIKGHHFEDGKRITIILREVGKRGGYETQYGYNYIVNYIDLENRAYKYIGTNPLSVMEEFTEVKATVKHDNYRGVAETKLKRMALTNKKPDPIAQLNTLDQQLTQTAPGSDEYKLIENEIAELEKTL